LSLIAGVAKRREGFFRMRVARRRFLASAVSSAMTAAAAPAVIRLAWGDAPQVTLKLHHFFSAVASGHDKFLAPWARKVEADSGGRIRIDLFPSMQLGGTPAQLFDQVRDGTADIAWIVPGLTPDRFPRIELFELPFVPSRRALVSSKAIEDFAATNLKDEFADVHPICFSCTDRGVIHATRPVRTVEDVEGLSLHVDTRLAGEAMRVLGARPVPMPIAQLPLAVTQHVVDGCIDPWHVLPTLRLNDILKNHTEFSDLSLSSTPFVLAMNKPVYDRLPGDLKAVIDRNSGQAAATLAGTMWDLQAAAVSDMVVQRGDPIVTLLPEAVAHWRKATDPVVEVWTKKMKERKLDGGKLIAGVQALLTKYAKEPEPQPTQARPREQEAVTQPAPRPEAKIEATAPAKPEVPALRPPAPPAAAAAPAPKPAVAPAAAPPSAPAPHVAAPATGPAPASQPAPTAPPPVASSTPPAPTAPPVALAPAPAPPSAPVVTAAPAPVPQPVPKPVPAPPKTLDIPL
jgi:TRAP-type C4-dicarboxylate transport system substrate-binding protein